jgi:hypothetical protein
MPTSEEDERELKVAVMQADLQLKTRQSFWETPRNLALIVAAAAAVSGALGFKLGQREPLPAPPAPPQTIILQLPPGLTAIPAPAK